MEIYSEAEGVWLPGEVQGATGDHTATVVFRWPAKGGGERLRKTVDMRDASKVHRPADAAPSLPDQTADVLMGYRCVAGALPKWSPVGLGRRMLQLKLRPAVLRKPSPLVLSFWQFIRHQATCLSSALRVLNAKHLLWDSNPRHQG